LWGYNGEYPVAKVVGKTHSESLASGINQAVLDNPSSENALSTELDKLRSMPVSLVSSSTYKPMVGISSSTYARGQMITYEYDALNRLVHVKEDGNIIQNIKYNYGLGTAPATSPQSLFYNLPIQQDFTKQGCPTGMHGEV
ncbi:MAG TPA: RHS repeat protein, partial [Chitinophagaceae bacterium]|nr:RHS repeat protein [Chitinophagaceae bacterium]